MASAAVFSSSPSTSNSTRLPIPAASIITPMMLLALTRRSLRVMKTSLLKVPANLVNLADARACRPSLLLMVTWVLIISARFECLVLRFRGRHLHHALRGAGHRAHHNRFERFGCVAKYAPQHRLVDASDHPNLRTDAQALGHVAGRGTE